MKWVAAAGIILAAAAGGSGCSAEPPAPAAPAPVSQGDANDIVERSVLLNDGRTVVCLTWQKDNSLDTGQGVGGMSCDWANAEGSK